jgi:tmRNA-binding protein
MKSNFVKKIILLKQMLDDMEQDVGLASLSGVEKNVYLAAQDMKSSIGLVETKQILDHRFTQKMSRPTFFRALKSIEAKGWLSHSDGKKVGLFVVVK